MMTDDMTCKITSLREGTMTTGETMVTIHTTTTIATTDVFMIVTVTMKSGIMIVPVTADMTHVVVHHVDVPGAVGEMSDHGHPSIVHVSILFLSKVLVIIHLACIILLPASQDCCPRSPTLPPHCSSPHPRSPSTRLAADVRSNASLLSRLSAPPESNSRFDLENAVDN